MDSRRKVRVMDDEDDIRTLLATRLRRGGYEPIVARDGHEGLRLFYSDRPDLVILDVAMPVMDGWQVLERLREVSNVPVKVLFAPDHAPEMEIMKQMIKARERIDFAIFTFSQSSGIADVMVRLAKTGFLIRGGFDAVGASQKSAASLLMKAAKIPTCAVRQDGSVVKPNANPMIISREV